MHTEQAAASHKPHGFLDYNLLSLGNAVIVMVTLSPSVFKKPTLGTTLYLFGEVTNI